MTYRKTTFLLTTVLTFLLTSCAQDNYKLFIVFDNVDGLTTKSSVTANGLKIGTVDKLGLFKNKVLATASIAKNVQIPTGSIFKLNSVDILGQKAIEVSFHKTATTHYADKDTIYEQLKTNSFTIETVNYTQPTFMLTVNIDGNRLLKTCECFDKQGHKTEVVEEIDSCKAFLVHNAINSSKMLIATYKQNNNEWIKNEYGFNGKIIDTYRLYKPTEVVIVKTDSMFIEKPDPPYDLYLEIYRYYEVFTK